MRTDELAKTQTETPPSDPSLVSSAHPHIVKSPDVCGGDARVAGTRLTVWGLEEWRRLGWGDKDLLAAYPALSLEILDAVREYTTAHEEEIEAAIRSNHEA